MYCDDHSRQDQYREFALFPIPRGDSREVSDMETRFWLHQNNVAVSASPDMCLGRSRYLSHVCSTDDPSPIAVVAGSPHFIAAPGSGAVNRFTQKPGIRWNRYVLAATIPHTVVKSHRLGSPPSGIDASNPASGPAPMDTSAPCFCRLRIVLGALPPLITTPFGWATVC